MPRRALVTLAALAALAGPAAAQANRIPDLPRPEEVVERTNAILDESPEERVEVEGVARLTYKRLPLDVRAVALKFGATLSGAQAPSEPLDRYVRQFEGRIATILDQRLADVGQLEVLAPLELKGKTIPPGTYRVGIGLEGGRPAALILQGEALPRGRPVPVKLKARRPEGEPEADGALRLRLAEPPAKDPPPRRPEPRGLDIVVNLRGQEAVSSPRLTVEAPPTE